MEILIFKKYVRPECFQYFGLLDTSQEKDFINVDTPMAKCIDYAQLSRSIPCRYYCDPYRGKLYRER